MDDGVKMIFDYFADLGEKCATPLKMMMIMPLGVPLLMIRQEMSRSLRRAPASINFSAAAPPFRVKAGFMRFTKKSVTRALDAYH